MTKLKWYHIGLLTGFFLILGLVIFFLVDAIIFATKQENPGNAILFIICDFVLIAIIGLFIYNTFHSIKHGSNFIKVLLYDDKRLITKGLVITSITLVCFIIILVYVILIKCGVNVPLNTMPLPLADMIIGLMVFCIFNSVAILLFPLLGKEDISFKKKQKF